MRWIVGSDHGGFVLRTTLCEHITQSGHEIVAVFGPEQPGESCDYPDVAREVCSALLRERGSSDASTVMGLLICGTGQGMAMSANRIRGIRAALVSDVFSARMAREHNDANVLCLGERVMGPGLAVDLWTAFTGASFAAGRHARRVGKIEAMPVDGEAGS